jgi:glycine betaine/proline transport system permease protein
MVGGGGLGAVVVQAVTTLDIGKGFEGGLAVVIVAIYLDRVTAAFGQHGIRLRRRSAPLRAPVDDGDPAVGRPKAEVGAA